LIHFYKRKLRSCLNKMLEGIEMAPFRSIDEFLTSESKFEMPELNNPEKMSSKIVSNLLYYQTNYFISFLTIFLLVFFFVPWKMLYIIILLALVFGAQHYMSLHHVHVKVWKKNHPTAVMTATFIIGTFFIYQFGWFTVFFWSVFLPILLIATHSFLHVKGKTLVVKGPFWKKKKEIELEPNEFYQITSVAEVGGVSKETPMAKLLHEWGIPAEFKCIS